MHDLWFFIAILCSIGVGYVIADSQGQKRLRHFFRTKVRRTHGATSSLSLGSHYYLALTSLLNEQTDEALDTFVSSMDVNTDTLEMHLALGALLRRRGEFDRALRVHQNLLAQPNLPSDKVHNVQLELACDYWRSGLLDRAETLLKELLSVRGLNKGTRWQASAYLLEIYQELGDWLQAIDIADTLTAKKFAQEPDLWRRMQAQFCCELAEQAMAQNNNDDIVLSKIRSALAYDPACVRANLLHAHFSLLNNERTTALIALKAIPLQDPRAISEIIEPIQQCFVGPDEKALLLEQLKGLSQYGTSVILFITLCQFIYEQEGEDAARQFWLDQIDRYTDLIDQTPIINILLKEQHAEKFKYCLELVCDLISKQLRYRCEQCGFELSTMKWRCASCHSWATVVQVYGA